MTESSQTPALVRSPIGADHAVRYYLLGLQSGAMIWPKFRG